MDELYRELDLHHCPGLLLDHAGASLPNSLAGAEFLCIARRWAMAGWIERRCTSGLRVLIDDLISILSGDINLERRLLSVERKT